MQLSTDLKTHKVILTKHDGSKKFVPITEKEMKKIIKDCNTKTHVYIGGEYFFPKDILIEYLKDEDRADNSASYYYKTDYIVGRHKKTKKSVWEHKYFSVQIAEGLGQTEELVKTEYRYYTGYGKTGDWIGCEKEDIELPSMNELKEKWKTIDEIGGVNLQQNRA